MTVSYRPSLLALGLILAACSASPASSKTMGEFDQQTSIHSIHVLTSEPKLTSEINANSNVIAEVQTAIVVSIGDGDTLRVNQDGNTITVRLACIDSPEADQPGGAAAADRLRQLLPRDQTVQLIPVDTDRYGRTVAVVFVNGRSINLQLVKEGLAVVYPQYLSNCPNSRNDLLAAEDEARSAESGVWAQANPVMPWDWRQGINTSIDPMPSPAPLSLPGSSSTSGLPACVNSDCDCKDFQTQAEAQRVFEAFAGDPFRLDGDNDGQVCEALP